MREIVLDAKDWRGSDDLWAALIPALEAPEWHGRNLDALHDSIVSELNGISRPYAIRLIGTANLSDDLRAYLRKVQEVFEFSDVPLSADSPL